MRRLRLCAVAAAVATVAGLTAPEGVAAAPATATPATAPHHASAPSAGSKDAVQWTSRPGQPRAGVVHYAGGLTARVAQHRTAPSHSGNVLQRAARDAHAGTQLAQELAAARGLATAPPSGGGTLSGTVTDTAGHPLAGVTVSGFAEGSPATTHTTTDVGGAYLLHLPARSATVEYDGSDATGGDSDATGYVGTFDRLALAAGQTRTKDIALADGAQLRVRATDRAGHPLAGVGPYLQPVEPYVVAPSGVIGIIDFATTDRTAADGTFTFRGVPRDASLVCFQTFDTEPTGGSSDATGYSGRCSRRLVAPAPGSDTAFPTVALSAADGGAVRGIVTDAAGAPIADALVQPFPSGHANPARAETTTAADGSYQLTGLKPGAYRICVDGFLHPTGRFGSRPDCEQGDINVGPGAAATANIQLRGGGAIGGVVTGPTGAPVAGVFVDAIGPDWEDGAVTDATGRYRVRDLPSEGYTVCFNAASAYDPGSRTGDLPGCYRHRQHVAVHAGSLHAGVNEQLTRGGSIAGQVTGVSISNSVDVEVDAEARGGPGFGYAEVDSAGNYRIVGLPAGSYQVCFAMDDLATLGGAFKCSKAPVQVRIGATTPLDESLAPSGSRGSIQVTVHDEAGRRVEGVDVAVLAPCSSPDPFESRFLCPSEPLFGHRGHARVRAAHPVDDFGRTDLAGLKPGNYAVCLFAYYGVTGAGAPSTGYADRCAGRSFNVAVAAGSTTRRTVTLHPSGLVTGRVVDAGGHPIKHAQVHVSHSAAADYSDDFEDFPDEPMPTGSPLGDSFTQASGQYSIRGVRPGAQRICVFAARAVGGDSTGGYLDTCAPAQVTVSANASSSAPDTELPAGSAITGTVHDGNGHPLRDVEIGVFAPGKRRPVVVALDDRDGQYRVAGLTPGTYLVCFADYRRAVECYDQVRWLHVNHRPFPPKGANDVVVPPGATATGVDAVLRRHK